MSTNVKMPYCWKSHVVAHLLTFKSRFKSVALMIECQAKCFQKVTFSSTPFDPNRRKLIGQKYNSPGTVTKHVFTIPKT